MPKPCWKSNSYLTFKSESICDASGGKNKKQSKYLSCTLNFDYSNWETTCCVNPENLNAGKFQSSSHWRTLCLSGVQHAGAGWSGRKSVQGASPAVGHRRTRAVTVKHAASGGNPPTNTYFKVNAACALENQIICNLSPGFQIDVYCEIENNKSVVVNRPSLALVGLVQIS